MIYFADDYFVIANSVDPNEMPHKGDSSIERVIID